jgi:excisionase family DNA binding protein
MSIISSTGITRNALHEVKPLTLTVATAREISGLGNTTIWALIKSGKLESVLVGRRRLITYRSLERLLSPASTGASNQSRRHGRPPKTLRATA